MQAELIRDVAGIGPIEDDWRRLAEQRENPFVTPEWFRSWWAHNSASADPLVIAVRNDEGALAGLMPLVLDRSRRPRAICFAGSGLGDRFHPVAAAAEEDEVAAAAMRALEAERLDRHMLLLEKVAADASWWKAMQAGSSVRRVAISQQQSDMPYIPLDGLDYETYLASRSQKLRKTIRNRGSLLEREHAMKMRAASDETLESDLVDLFRLHRLRFGEGSSLEEGTEMAELHDFAVASQRRGWLRLHTLEADGESVASVIGWRLGGSYTSFQGGFDPAWNKQSVGTVLEALTIRNAIEEGASEYDFLLGAERYKLRFTDDVTRPAQTVVITRALRPLRLLIGGEALARRAGRRLAENDRFAGIVRSLRRLLPTARGS